MALTSDARIPYQACPLCAHASMETVKRATCHQHPLYHPDLPEVMTWMKCNACGHVFTDGYFTDEANALIFAKTQETQTLGHQMEEQRPVSARMVEKVLPHQSSGVWMDVGVGNGSLIFTADEYGFKAVGLDLRSDAVDRLRKMGFEAHCADFQTISNDASMNVISMADVLEHMPFPVEALKHAHRLLVDGGVLLISLPNSENIIWKLRDHGNMNPYWGEIEHYHNFSRSRLFQLLADAGFRSMRYGISERYLTGMEVLAIK